MLMNNLDPEVAERPDDLVVYGGSGRAARSWAAFDAIVATLRALEDDETLLVQSGKPVGVFRTHRDAPRVLIANALLVPAWATWEKFRDLEDRGLTMYGQMTAGQLDLHRHAGHPAGHLRDARGASAGGTSAATLAGRLVVTAGLGGMGGAQPLAVTMNDGVALVVEVDPHAHRAAPRHAVPRRGDRRRSTTRSRAIARWPREQASRGRSRSARQRRRRAARARRARRRCPTSSPTRPRRTTR